MATNMDSFAVERRMMVDGQIRTSDVTDSRILAAFGAVPREKFVPPEQADLAYLDRDVPLTPGAAGHSGRCILKPMVLAKMMHAAEIGAADRILDVGCGSGYSTAVLAHLAGEVVGLEENPALADRAERVLQELAVRNAVIHRGPLAAGDPAEAPFDVIFVNGAVEHTPEPLLRQLKVGGRLVCVERQGSVGKAMLYRSAGHEVSGRSIFDASAPLLPGFVTPPAFVF
jgi:protein-L-isoaspartate(D-aspartate) O-methyltransferase